MNFTYTTSRSPTSVRPKPTTTRRIGICRWIRSTLFDVLAAGWGRGQEDDGELERRRRRYPNLCESSFYEYISIRIDPETEDRSILCCRRNLGLGVRAGPQAKLPGHLSVLPRKHLSNLRRFKWLPGHHPPHTPRSVHSIFSTYLCRMGQLALDSQLGHQSYMRTFGDITPAMGPAVHEGHPDTIRPTQTGPDPGILYGGCRKTSPSADSRSVACIVAPLSFPVLHGPRCVPFQYQSYGFQGGDIVDRFLYRGVHIHHIHADVST